MQNFQGFSVHYGRDDSSKETRYSPALILFSLAGLCLLIMSPWLYTIWVMRRDNVQRMSFPVAPLLANTPRALSCHFIVCRGVQEGDQTLTESPVHEAVARLEHIQQGSLPSHSLLREGQIAQRQRVVSAEPHRLEVIASATDRPVRPSIATRLRNLTVPAVQTMAAQARSLWHEV